tara:strand:+ start:199 stop:585 length:387 start_codon:yes stop_codon:yes gene_type:complete
MLSQGETMEKVTVPVEDVLKALKENYERHQQEYDAAYKGYQKQAEILLNERLEEISASSSESDQVNLVFDLCPPEDHRDDYERAIGMLEMTTEEETRITATQYAAFIQDKWSWQQNWKHSNRAYTRSW